MKPSPYLAPIPTLPIDLVQRLDEVDCDSADGQILEGVLDAVGAMAIEDIRRLRTADELGRETAIEVEPPTDPDYGRKPR